MKWGVIKLAVQDLVTNDLVDEINRFNLNQIVDDAKAYRFH